MREPDKSNSTNAGWLNPVIGPCVFFFAALAILSAPASEYSVDGFIKYEVYFLNGKTWAEQENSFHFHNKDCEWYVGCVPLRFVKLGKDQELFSSEIASSDGTNFYELESLQGLTKSPLQSQNYAGRVGPGAVPFGLSDPRLIILWYAFGSSCYFPDIKGEFVNPPTILAGQEIYAKDFRVSADWKLEADPPFLPTLITFKDLPRCQSNDFVAGHFTNCLYLVKDFADAKGLKLPKTVFVSYFDRNPTNRSLDWLAGKMEIDVTNFQSGGASCKFTPAIPGHGFISDLRTISTLTPFAVAEVKGSTWPDPSVSKRIAAQIASSMARQKSGWVAGRNKPKVVRLVLLTFTLFSMTAISLLLWRVIKMRPSVNTNYENEK